jgi:hypothetical protein
MRRCGPCSELVLTGVMQRCVIEGIEIRNEAKSEECRARCKVRKGCYRGAVRSVYGGGWREEESSGRAGNVRGSRVSPAPRFETRNTTAHVIV